MGFWNKIFGKKEEPTHPLMTESVTKPSGKVCDRCGFDIMEGEPSRYFGGSRFHKKCFKELKKEAVRFSKGYN